MEQLGNCLQLQELEVELNFSVRDHSLLCWRNLNRMRRLRLTGNLSLGDEAVAGVLRGMPLLQVCALENFRRSASCWGRCFPARALHITASSLAAPLLERFKLCCLHAFCLQELCLEQLHGSGAILAPLAAMSALRSLSLAGCHLLGTEALTASLSSATSLVSLQIKVSR